MLKLAFTLAISLAILQYVSAACNVCNSNGVACVNEKEFHLCFNGQPNPTTSFSCLGQNEVCTNGARACMDKRLNTTIPACGDKTNCGICKGTDDGSYTCTSRKTYTMCLGSRLTQIRGTCRKNQLCDAGLGKQGKNPCVPGCKEQNILLCDLDRAIDDPVTTTVVPPITTTELPTTTEEIPTITTEYILTTTEIETTTSLPTTTQNPAERFCSRQTAVGRYPNPYNNTCKDYINCFFKGSFMQSNTISCPIGLYFSPSDLKCVTVKPQGCA